MTPDPHSRWMREAIAEAEQAANEGEVPVGAVIVVSGEIIARAHNLVEKNSDASQHAELLCIQQASRASENWRLNQASLYVTLEPCTMCMGLVGLSRVKNLYFGCSDPRMGAVGSLYDLSTDPRLPHQPAVFGGILESECRELLQRFFQTRRSTGIPAEVTVPN